VSAGRKEWGGERREYRGGTRDAAAERAARAGTNGRRMRTSPLLAGAALAMSSSGCAAYNGIFGVCEGLGFSAQVNQSIPDNNDTGITSTINMPVTGRPDGIGVTLNIDHELDSDLQIRLAHNTTIIEIDDLGDHGPFHEFDGLDAGGPWTINVADTLSADTGYWTDWEIVICGE
jgi:hypothetical protein